MRVFLLGLSACTSTPTDILMDEPPVDDSASDPNAPPAAGLTIGARGRLAGVDGHRATGQILLFSHPDGRHLVRFEGADIQGGPDLHVWLVRRLSGDLADGHVTLGPLRSTRGDQNYSAPIEADPSQFRGLSIWCEDFSVNFGQGALN
ncbi:DM13 domain-containing protein [Rubrivirga sp.]|uniref:DM13 domain-containing protein n=1 Tax=Rubrivirga sp. TaxID=1885344 RepID=UPI003C752D73